MSFEKKYILAIESSGKVCGIALLSFNDNPSFAHNSNFELLSEYNIYVGNKHDKFLAELSCRILNDNDLKTENLSAVAVSIGPGSFTGLRIGSALARGLCFDSENEKEENSIKLIAVPTLKALAYKVSIFLKSTNYFEKNNVNDCKTLSIIPSHNDLVYEQLFDFQNNNLTEISFSKIDEVKNKYAQEEKLFLSTNYKIDIDLGIYSPEFSQITVATVGKLAIQMYKNDEFTEAEKLVPLYIQDFIPNNHNS